MGGTHNYMEEITTKFLYLTFVVSSDNVPGHREPSLQNLL